MPQMCRFFLAGKCQWGAQCGWSHQVGKHKQPKRTPCSFFLRGYCKNGDGCSWEHAVAKSEQVASESQMSRNEGAMEISTQRLDVPYASRSATLPAEPDSFDAPGGASQPGKPVSFDVTVGTTVSACVPDICDNAMQSKAFEGSSKDCSGDHPFAMVDIVPRHVMDNICPTAPAAVAPQVSPCLFYSEERKLVPQQGVQATAPPSSAKPTKPPRVQKKTLQIKKLEWKYGLCVVDALNRLKAICEVAQEDWIKKVTLSMSADSDLVTLRFANMRSAQIARRTLKSHGCRLDLV